MLKKIEDKRKQIEFLCIDDLVPKDHLVRKIDKAIDFSFIYDEVKYLYSEKGRPSIDPVSLIKIVLVQYMFGIQSMRQTIKELEVNVAYKWFCGFDVYEKIPHFSTFGKNYVRRFKGTKVFENIFNKILNEAEKNGFLNTESVYMDSTHIKASANKNKKREKYIRQEAKGYEVALLKEINAEREGKGKKEILKETKKKEHRIAESTVDKDAGLFHKGEHEKMFAYSAHTVCDENTFILDFKLTAGNVHDSRMFSPLYNSLKSKYNFKIIALDAGYKTPAIAKEILEDKKIPLMPYTRPKGKTREFIYDKYYDYYVCPEGNVLEHTNTNRLGYKEYTGNKEMCKGCPNRGSCLSKTQNKKKLFRHVWKDGIDKVNELRRTDVWKKYYPKRKETIERSFGFAKEQHGMRYTRLRGKKKVGLEVLLIYACMNLKKLANWKWKNEKSTINAR